MKKNYIFTLALIFTGMVNYAQTDAETNVNTLSDDEKNEILNQVQTQKGQNGFEKVACNDTLGTPLLAGNGHSGVMFDITVGSNDIVVSTFWVSQDATENVAIFYKNGTFVGSETNAAAWTFLDSAITPGNGNGTMDSIPVSLNLLLTANTTYGFYITQTNNSNINYTNGTTVGNVLASNADLTIYEGAGLSYPFGSTFTPRNFNGMINYCQATVTSTKIQDINTSVSLYPNPATSQLTIDLGNLTVNNSTEIKIYNLIGEEVFSQTNPKTNKIVVNTANLNKGLYFVKVISNNHSYSYKFTIE